MYTQRQAMTVAMFNAGLRSEDGEGFPFALADRVLANLTSMGFLLDGYVHEESLRKNKEGLAQLMQQYPEIQSEGP